MDPVIKAASRPSELQAARIAAGSGQARLYFTTPLAIHLPTNFNIKFRAGPNYSWKWVKDHQGTIDGVVMLSTVTSQDAISSELADYVADLNPILKSKNYRSQSPGTTLWSVEAPIEGADGEKSAIKDIKFGLPWGKGKFSRSVTSIVSRHPSAEISCADVVKMVCSRPNLVSMACPTPGEVQIWAGQRSSHVLIPQSHRETFGFARNHWG